MCTQQSPQRVTVAQSHRKLWGHWESHHLRACPDQEHYTDEWLPCRDKKSQTLVSLTHAKRCRGWLMDITAFCERVCTKMVRGSSEGHGATHSAGPTLWVQENQEMLGVSDLKARRALAKWLSWLECHPIHQKVEGLIPSQGTYLGCGFDPWSGCLQKATG